MALLTTPDPELGTPAPAFRLPATSGNSVALDDVAGAKGTVIAFICNHCPYVIAVIDRMVRDFAELQAEGIGAAAICSNDAAAYPADSFPRMAAFAEAHGLGFPYLHDADQTVARAYGAVCTPDFFGFDADLRLRYRGRLDAGRPGGGDPGPRDLVEAMRAIAADGSAPASQAPSMGCSIKWRAA